MIRQRPKTRLPFPASAQFGSRARKMVQKLRNNYYLAFASPSTLDFGSVHDMVLLITIYSNLFALSKATNLLRKIPQIQPFTTYLGTIRFI